MTMKLLLASTTLLIGAVSVCESTHAQQPGSCKAPLIVEAAVAPQFPEVARKARSFGTSYVSVDVDDNGVVTNAADAPKLTSHPLFQPTAIEAAKRWRFQNAVGCSTRTATLVFDFKQPVPRGWGAGTIFRPPFTVEIVVEEVWVQTAH